MTEQCADSASSLPGGQLVLTAGIRLMSTNTNNVSHLSELNVLCDVLYDDTLYSCGSVDVGLSLHLFGPN